MDTQKLGDLLGSRRDNKLYRESEELVTNEHAVGVELELENINYYHHESKYPEIFNMWRAVEDGSLREGTEFIFGEPYMAMNIIYSLEIMQKFLNQYERKGSKVKVSDRCAVHVHLDVRDLDENQLYNLILVYMLVERILFQYIDPARAKNNYCRPLTDSLFKYTLSKIKGYSHANQLHKAMTIIKDECDKYSALNILPINTFGSVEFRHHEGTTDMEKVKRWINVILALKLASIKYSIEYLLDIIKNQGHIALLNIVFEGTDLFQKVESLPLLKEIVFKGVTDVKEILDFDTLKALNKYGYAQNKVAVKKSLKDAFIKAQEAKANIDHLSLGA